MKRRRACCGSRLDLVTAPAEPRRLQPRFVCMVTSRGMYVVALIIWAIIACTLLVPTSP
jgi:hypothetical protein